VRLCWLVLAPLFEDGVNALRAGRSRWALASAFGVVGAFRDGNESLEEVSEAHLQAMI
jgi:hypothetical protein